VSDGLRVEPEKLYEAAPGFYEGGDMVGDSAGPLSALTLDPTALGDVPAAAEFASALAQFAGRQGDDLSKGGAWIVDAGHGLVENAQNYSDSDEQSAAGLRSGGGQ